MFICFFFVSVFAANAQWSVAPEVGVSMFKTESEKATVSPRIGVGVNYSFTDNGRWGLNTGLYFYQKRGTENSTAIWLDGGDIVPFYLDGTMTDRVDMGDITKICVVENNSRRSFLQLPVLATYTWKFAENTNLTFGIGPYVAWRMTGKYEMNFQEYDKEGAFHFSEYDIRLKSRFEVGLSAMLALEVNRWVTKVSYEKILTRNDWRFQGGEHLISLSLGYRFSL